MSILVCQNLSFNSLMPLYSLSNQILIHMPTLSPSFSFSFSFSFSLSFTHRCSRTQTYLFFSWQRFEKRGRSGFENNSPIFLLSFIAPFLSLAFPKTKYLSHKIFISFFSSFFSEIFREDPGPINYGGLTKLLWPHSSLHHKGFQVNRQT